MPSENSVTQGRRLHSCSCEGAIRGLARPDEPPTTEARRDPTLALQLGRALVSPTDPRSTRHVRERGADLVRCLRDHQPKLAMCQVALARDIGPKVAYALLSGYTPTRTRPARNSGSSIATPTSLTNTAASPTRGEIK